MGKGFLKILIILFLVPVLSYAADPSISDISGTFSGGQSVIVSGSNFGSTGPTIHKWDDFEGATHTLGQTVGSGPDAIAWQYNSGVDPNWNEPKVSDTSLRTNSTKYIRCTYNGTGNVYGCILHYQYEATLDPAYVTWYMRWDNVGSGETNNEKFWRIYSGSSLSVWSMPYFSMARIGGDSAGINWIAGHGGSSDQSWETAPDENEWIRMEFYGEESSNGVADGLIILTQQTSDDGTFSDKWNDATQETRDNGDHWESVFFGSYAAMAAGRLYYHDFDDIYIANSRARVEIGDNATWANCTHREIQIPTAWAAGEITITVNQGSFDSDDTAYLFAVDSNGNVSNGYEITIDQSSGMGGVTIS